MRIRLGGSLLLMTTLGAVSAPAAAQSGDGRQAVTLTRPPTPSGTWMASKMPYGPWVIELTQSGATLTGTVQQSSGEPGPSRISDGTIQGNQISFNVISPDGFRTITFTGTLAGDSIVFDRVVETRGYGGSTGVFGAYAITHFTLGRSDHATAAATLAAAAAGGGPCTMVPPIPTQGSTSVNPRPPATGRPAGTVALARDATAAGYWIAPDMDYGPWVIELTQLGAKLTGNVRQAAGQRGPVEIEDGSVQGGAISFKVPAPDCDRTITFTGTVGRDSMVLDRAVETRGATGMTGIFGAYAVTHFSLARSDSATAIAALATPRMATSRVIAGMIAGPVAGPAARPARIQWPPAPLALLNYNGFAVDTSAMASPAERNDVSSAIRAQLDMVAAVNADTDKTRFFRAVPIFVVASAASIAYQPGTGKILVPAHPTRPFDPSDPILLREMLRAYQDQQLPDGLHNMDVQRLFEPARLGALFPLNSHMMSSVAEYFASVTTAYLHGSAAAPDGLTRDAIQTKQPDLYQWLVKEFGPLVPRLGMSPAAPARSKSAGRPKTPGARQSRKSQSSRRADSLSSGISPFADMG